MPVLVPGGAILNTIADVNSRVRSITNDDNAQLYPDGSTQLLNAVRDAYNWLYGQIQRIAGSTFEPVMTDITYTPSAPGSRQDLGSILPADFYMPVKLEFRLNTSETYVELNRVDKVANRNQDILTRLTDWEFRGSSIIVNSSNAPGLLQLTYRSLLPAIALTTDPVLIPNAIEAIAHYAAYELFRRRGQMVNAMAAMGDDGSRNGNIPMGAKGFASMILDHLVLNEQEIPRRGQRYSNGGYDNVGNRQQNM